MATKKKAAPKKKATKKKAAPKKKATKKKAVKKTTKKSGPKRPAKTGLFVDVEKIQRERFIDAAEMLLPEEPEGYPYQFVRKDVRPLFESVEWDQSYFMEVGFWYLPFSSEGSDDQDPDEVIMTTFVGRGWHCLQKIVEWLGTGAIIASVEMTETSIDFRNTMVPIYKGTTIDGMEGVGKRPPVEFRRPKKANSGDRYAVARKKIRRNELRSQKRATAAFLKAQGSPMPMRGDLNKGDVKGQKKRAKERAKAKRKQTK